MNCYAYSHLSNGVLLKELAASVSQDQCSTATMLGYLGEVDARKLYVPASYASMFMYCVREHHMSEDMAYKRILAARTARRVPAIFPALAEGRLHLTAVVLLAPHLKRGSADELLAAAAHKSTGEIRLLLAHRFPSADIPTRVRAIGAPAPSCGTAMQPETVNPLLSPATTVSPLEPNSPSNVEQLVSKPVGPMVTKDAEQLVSKPVAAAVAQDAAIVVAAVSLPVPERPRVAPLSPGRFALQLTMGQITHDLLREAQSLLGHAVAPGDVEAVLQRALRELVSSLRKQRFANCARPRPQRAGTRNRYIPAAVKREVSRRDGGRCTFVNESGRRCEERFGVEFDHILPVTRGGQSTVANLRLRCRAHNQYAAEHTLGQEFMRGKRQSSQGQSLRSGSRVEAAASSAG
jgi:5-methylcytosine-specific restriction endonuclease McrA